MKRSIWGVLALYCWLATSAVQAQTTGAPAPAAARPAAAPSAAAASGAAAAAAAPTAAPGAAEPAQPPAPPKPAPTVPLPGEAPITFATDILAGGAVNFPPWKGSTLRAAIVRGMSCGHHGRKIVVARTGGAMISILKDVVLFSCVTLVVTGIVIAAATLLI